MIFDFFSLAFTNLKQRQLRSWLTMIGIFIGIAAVIALISIGQGLKVAINEQFSIIGADKIIVHPKSAGFGPLGALSPGQITKDDLKLIERVNGVAVVSGRLLKPVRIEFNNKVITNFAVSWPEKNSAMELIREFNNYQADKGRMLNKNDKGKVMLGQNFNTDKFFGEEVRPGNKILVNNKEFRVVGILKTIGDPERDGSVLINENEMRQLLGVPEEYSMLIAKVSQNSNVDKISEDIARTLRRDRHLEKGKEDVEVETPQQLLNSFNTIFNVVQAVLIGIAAISLLVGGIGIMNTMYTSVLERTREIGILKAIGATKKNILTLFIIESSLIGLFGGAIGVFIGIALSKIVEIAASHAFGSPLIRAEITLSLVFFSLLFSFVIGTLSGVMPAKKAAELQPVEALRYE
ncbi:ABC transporter permease [Candidatus Woesearchaeota archaeon]|nr:ABC transporter permease [Candidatus Woesearchaeota archaeon]